LHPAGYCGRNALAQLASGVFRHLNHERNLGHGPTDWLLGPRTQDRLWAVTLHYHAWLYELARTAAGKGIEAEQAATLLREYLGDWLGQCALDQPGARDLAWNAFAIATRIGWWVRTYRTLAPESLGPEFLGSLWQQAAYLHDHLEWDLRANHLLRGAVGLAWAGRFFAEPQAQRWLTTAARLARQQAQEQVLADGGHFERSPMYHLQIMEDMGTLICLLEDAVAVSELRSCWSRMAQFLAWATHPDGKIPLLNDAARNGAPCPEQMLKLGGQLGLSTNRATTTGGRYFSDTGLVVWHGDPWAVFFDVGPIGPDYQPGHAHADNLTIEASFRERQLFVDPGTHSYDFDERRRYDRATSSHNTVCIDGQDSSEMWQIFRVGRRARPIDVQVTFSDRGMRATAGHTGYAHLPGSPIHRREVRIDDQSTLLIHDRLSGTGSYRLQGGYLLAPEWSVSKLTDGWQLQSEDRQVQIVVIGPNGMRLSQRSAWYHPEFGLEQDTQRLEWAYDGTLPVEIRTEVKSA
jgi:uncharacterized heparinase superfamily protein